MSPGKKRLEQAAPNGRGGTLRVLLLYEDKATGLRAKRVLDGVLKRLKSPACALQAWRLDLLQHSRFARAAARRVPQAELVLVWLQGHRGLRKGVKGWFETAFQRRSGKPCALALCLEANHRESPEALQTALWLYWLAQDCGTELLLHFGRSPARQAKPDARAPGAGTQSLTSKPANVKAD